MDLEGDEGCGNWEPLGDVFYEKIEVYDMDWVDKMLKNYKLEMAPCGGPIALAWDSRQLTRGQPRKLIEIYNSAGILINEIAIKHERILVVGLGWSMEENLVVVTDIGSIYVYDINGVSLSLVSANAEIQDSRVIEARVFPTYGGTRTGVAVLTGAYRFFVISDIASDNPTYHKMNDIPGLDNPPSSWAVLPQDRSIEILVSNNAKLYLIERDRCTPKYAPRMHLSSGCVIEMALLNKTLDIALFSENGALWAGSADLQTTYCEVDTGITNRPSQMCWCGTYDSMMEMSAGIVLVWNTENMVRLYGISGTDDHEPIEYLTDGEVFVVPEMDGVRMISSKAHELIRRVPVSLVEVLGMGSLQPGAVLFDAQKEFNRESHKANEYMQVIVEKNSMELAVKQCINAAACSTSPKQQKNLLRAASYGKGFLAYDNPDHFVEICKTLRVLNEIRMFRIGIPMTYSQLHQFTAMGLVKRLVAMKLYCLAIPIVDHIKLEGGKELILSQWAMDKVRQSRDTDEEIVNAITKKLGSSLGDVFLNISSVVNEAKKAGRKELAISLLDFEPRSSEQVPALMRMNQNAKAMEKAIASGDMDLVHTVLVAMEPKERDSGKIREFNNTLKDNPQAKALYTKWCAQTDVQKLHTHYETHDNYRESALLYVQELDHNCLPEAKLKLLEDIDKLFRKGTISRDNLESQLTLEQVALIKRQEGLNSKVSGITGMNLNETIDLLIQRALFADAEGLRKEFKLSDRKFWWLKVRALTKARNWSELEKFAKSKKSPIGYKPFVDACLENSNKVEAVKYVERLPREQQVDSYMDLEMPEKAGEIARLSRGSEELFDRILSQIGPQNTVLRDRINAIRNNS